MTGSGKQIKRRNYIPWWVQFLIIAAEIICLYCLFNIPPSLLAASFLIPHILLSPLAGLIILRAMPLAYAYCFLAIRNRGYSIVPNGMIVSYQCDEILKSYNANQVWDATIYRFDQYSYRNNNLVTYVVKEDCLEFYYGVFRLFKPLMRIPRSHIIGVSLAKYYTLESMYVSIEFQMLRDGREFTFALGYLSAKKFYFSFLPPEDILELAEEVAGVLELPFDPLIKKRDYKILY